MHLVLTERSVKMEPLGVCNSDRLRAAGKEEKQRRRKEEAERYRNMYSKTLIQHYCAQVTCSKG